MSAKVVSLGNCFSWEYIYLYLDIKKNLLIGVEPHEGWVPVQCGSYSENVAVKERK